MTESRGAWLIGDMQMGDRKSLGNTAFSRARQGARGVVAALVFLCAALPAQASDLAAYLDADMLARVFPAADRAGEAEGTPPAAPAYTEGRLIGYVFLTSDVVASAGYSGKPVKLVGAIDLDGKVTGAAVGAHQEPILVLGIPDHKLDLFLAQYAGSDIRDRIRPEHRGGAIDMISGATITSVVFNDSIFRAARLVARSRHILAPVAAGAGAQLDVEGFRELTWKALEANGGLVRMGLSNAEVAAALKARPDANRRADAPFIEMFAGLATPSAVGQNLLGFSRYNTLGEALAKGSHALFVGAHGLYSYRGYQWRKTGVFDRLQLVQGERTIALTKAMHQSLESLAVADAPDLRETSLFVLPPETGFDPLKRWRLELLVAKGDATGIFPLTYELPAAFVIGGEAAQSVEEDRPLWQKRWIDSVFEIVMMLVALTFLLVLLFFHDLVAKSVSGLTTFRIGFLVFTLVFFGWFASAQLSVLNVLTFIGALLGDFHWEFFLLEPLIFILWSFVAVALLFWGRGVFCGWLCPFGALQELINRVSRHFKVPQLTIPFAVNERLWPFKYVVFLGLLALSLGPAELALTFAEVEPFKTAISLKFLRAFPFVLYAGLVLAGSIFVQRVFCRYLCPLGAALAIPAENRMFDWLKRRHACGRECNICASRCPVEAIHPNGRINPHECIYCLDCQAIYNDDHRCPPLIERRKRREERQKRKEERLAAKQQAGEATP